jgi:hypothetical protein
MVHRLGRDTLPWEMGDAVARPDVLLDRLQGQSLAALCSTQGCHWSRSSGQSGSKGICLEIDGDEPAI